MASEADENRVVQALPAQERHAWNAMRIISRRTDIGEALFQRMPSQSSFGAQYIHTNQWKKAVAEPNADAGAEAANELSLHYLSYTVLVSALSTRIEFVVLNSTLLWLLSS